MSVKIAVIGLHQLGASVGLAVKDYQEKIICVGFDPDRRQSDKVEKQKIFARVEIQLASVLKDSDLIILALPADEVHEMLNLIADDLKPEAVVVDTSLLHQGMDDFAAGVLSAQNHFISATPALNPQYLDEQTASIDEPHADLFHKGAFLVCCAPKTHPNAVKMAADLAELLGARPYFTDPVEADAILTKVEILPKLISAALVNATVDQPGWKDSSRLAGKAYLKTTAALQHLDETADLGKAALQVRENTLRGLDQVIDHLMQIRAAVDQNDASALKEFLTRAKIGREDWLAFRIALDWDTPSGLPEREKHEVPGHSFWFGQKGRSK